MMTATLLHPPTVDRQAIERPAIEQHLRTTETSMFARIKGTAGQFGMGFLPEFDVRTD